MDFSSLESFRVRTVLVPAGLAVLDKEVKKDKKTNKVNHWNYSQEDPPAAFSDIMQAANCQGNGWDKRSKAE